MSPKIVAESSTRYAQERPRARSMWQLAAISVVFCLLIIPVPAMGDEPMPEGRIEFNIPQQRADLALTQFAEQANLTLLFPFDGVRDRMANALTGEYTLDEAIEVLLAGTGLTPTFKNALVLDIAIDSDPTLDEDSMNTNKKAGVVAVLAGVLAVGANAQETNVTETEIQTSVVTGTVTDARTGANLKGAKVTIEETGQWTSTGDLGRFRFANVSEGEYTLTVSFLGYAGKSAAIGVQGGLVAQDFALRGGDEIEEIVVFGQRSARALALNQERAASNVTTVISSDLLGSFEGTTISEVLRKAPGVAFVENSVTGDGANIIVRGVDPDLNAVRLNGIELPETSGTGRSADLSNILAESVDSVTISKTLLPSQDTSGTGGLIEIETRSPLNRDDRFLSLLAETSFSDEDFQTETQLSATASGVFGAKQNFGLSGSVQYRTSERDNLGYGVFSQVGPWLPLQVDGSPSITSIRQVNPEVGFPFEEGADDYYIFAATNRQNVVEIDNLGLSLTAEWEPTDSTNLRFDYQLFNQETTTTTAQSALNTFQIYIPQPVAALDGEIRPALFDFGSLDLEQSVNWVPENETTTQVYSFRGQTNVNRFDFEYSAGYTLGESPRLEQITLGSNSSLFGLSDFLTEDAIDPVEGRILSPLGRRDSEGFVDLPLNDAGLTIFEDPNSYTLQNIQRTVTAGENERFDAAFSARYDVELGPWKYITAGIQFERSEFSSTLLSRESVFPRQPISDFGLDFTNSSFQVVGVDESLPFYDLGSVLALMRNAFSGGFSDDIIFRSIADDLTRSRLTTEDELAYYIETKFQFGDFDVVGGLRFSDYTVEADTVSGTSVFDEDDNRLSELNDQLDFLARQQADQFVVLPRFQVNYRPSENIVARFGYFQSASRPQIASLNDEQTVTLSLNPRSGPNQDLPSLLVLSGNPTLEPPSTENFDISLEYYFSNIGVVKAGAFYKRTENFIQDVVTETTVGASELSDFIVLPDNEEFLALLPDELFIEEIIPTNSDQDAEIWGGEFSIERQLTELPGIWGGLGVFGNYTYTDSSRTTLAQWQGSPIFDDSGVFVGTESVTVEIDDVRFNQQPEHTGTVGVTYNKYGWDGVLSYTYQDRRPTSFRPNDLSLFSEPIDSLDLRVSYRPTADRRSWLFFVEGSDLLDSASDPSFETSLGGVNDAPRAIIDASFFGGRQIRIGVRKTF